MKKIFAVLLLLLTINCQLSTVNCENVVRLEAAAGTGSEYSVAELLRVELAGDYIRFIGTDGTQVAEVYKYDYVKLTVADKQPTAVEQSAISNQQSVAQKIIMNGQVYILFGDKAYRIDGTEVR